MAPVDIIKVQLVNAAGVVIATIPVSNNALLDGSNRTIVVGAAADGAVVAGNPVLIGGFDGTNAQAILTTLAGRLQVGTVSIAGDGAAQQLGLYDPNDVARPLATIVNRYDGTSYYRTRTPAKFINLNAVAIDTIATVWTPQSGKKFRLMGGCISVSAAVSVLFEDNAAGAGNFIFRVPKMLVDTPFQFTVGGNGLLSAAANNVLKATASAAANISGTLFGTEE